jgi:hypothetical protein
MESGVYIRPLNTSGPGSSAIAPICQRLSRRLTAGAAAEWRRSRWQASPIDGMTAEELQQTAAARAS